MLGFGLHGSPQSQSSSVHWIGDDGFVIRTSAGDVRSRFVVWAAGEFQYPRLSPFPGAELCLHNSKVKSWRAMKGDDFLILGGYESGVDAAIHLASAGKKVRILDRDAAWLRQDSDPSVTLSPFTRERLHALLATKLVFQLACGGLPYTINSALAL